LIDIAIFISGRLTCYDTNLIKILNYLDKKYHIDLFISLNNKRDEYHIIAEQRLSKWIKSINYEEYTVPGDFVQNIHPQSLLQDVNGYIVPYTNLSCFFNDRKCFDMIINYHNSIKPYDVVCKLRSDITFHNIENLFFNIPEIDTIYSCIPPCQIHFNGDEKNPICINDAFAFGNIKSMDMYTRTYTNILFLNNVLEGKYRVNYELSLTESIYSILYQTGYEIEGQDNYLEQYVDKLENYSIIRSPYEFIEKIKTNRIKIRYFENPYCLDPDRRSRDKIKH
jgi:hypothetical protein